MTTKAIHDVVVQIFPPSETSHGHVAEGRYTFEDGVVALVDYHGNPVKNVHGRAYAQKVNPDENPLVIARRLTKQFALARRGNDRFDFNRPLHYKRDGSIV
jgi:hypothetical protein